MRRRWFLAAAALAVQLGGCARAPGPVLDLGSRRELFVDRYLVATLSGTRLKLHEPRPAGVALRFDRPWEGPLSGYCSVIRDGNIYRLYYRGDPGEVKGYTGGMRTGSLTDVTCYAESPDGIHWVKPNLGLYEVMGSRENNVVLAGDPPYSSNFSAFLDTNPAVRPEERFKAVAGMGDNMTSFRKDGLPKSKSGLFGFVSPDGIHWRKVQDTRIFTDGSRVFDSQNVAFWSESEERYVLYYRQHFDTKARTVVRKDVVYLPHHAKTVARATSADFIHWSEPELMDFGPHPPTDLENLYTSQTHPYFRAPHLYIALAARWMRGRGAVDDRTVERILAELEAAGHQGFNWNGSRKAWQNQDCSDTVLLTSRGRNRYDRTFMESFIRPGGEISHWTSRGNFTAFGVVQTGPDEMSLYTQRRYGQVGAYLERLTLRLDGFASVNAPYEGGEMITKPFRFSGRELEINCATSAAGFLRIEIQDAGGAPLPEFALARCDEIFGDRIERVVTWQGNRDLSRVAGKAVRLRFMMKDADLYSLRFR